MEALLETHDDSSGANPSSVKSEDGSPPPDGDRGSPPPNCAICLGRCRNKSFTDSCLHQFCFKCLVTWSKVKTECPLCKQNFKSIIHNVQSNQQYEEYRVEQRRQEGDFERDHIEDLVTATRRFRYRTTLTFPRGNGSEHLTLQRLLLHYPISAVMGLQSRSSPSVVPAPLPSSRRRRSPSSFRRTVYRHNLWARPLPDFTGRHRDCTPEFYRNNGSQLHRLMPWLNRELHYLLLENQGHIAYVLDRILELLPQYHITSPQFRCDMYRYFGPRTDHFLHELHCFASTPYDLTGYDRNVQYTTDSRISSTVDNVISSSDTESGDSDLVLVYPTSPSPSYHPVSPVRPTPEPHPGPSAPVYPHPGPSAPVYPHVGLITTSSETARMIRDVISIETISQSDTDDDEVMVTGYIKPPHQRTPEVVDLRDSDSDVVVSEEPIAAPPRPRPLVKMTLSRPRSSANRASSEVEEGTYTPPPIPNRAYSSDESFVADCHTSSDSPGTPSLSPRRDRDWHRTTERTKRRRTRRSRDADRARTTDPDDSSAERDRHRDARKRKSCNGKGVKSSRRDTESRRADEPGPSTRSTDKRPRSQRVETDPTFALAEIHESRPEPYFRPMNQLGSSSRPDRSNSRRDETGSPRAALAEIHESRPEPFFRPGQAPVQPSRPDKRSKSRRVETDSARAEIQDPRSHSRLEERRVIPVDAPGPSSRPDKKSRSRRDDTSSRAFAEAQPGPSRHEEKSVKKEEPQPGPSSSSRHAEKKVKSRKNESRTSTESRRVEASTQVQDEHIPGPSRAEKLAKPSHREKRHESTTEKRSVSTSVQEDSRVSAKEPKPARRDASTETRAEPMEAQPGPSKTDVRKDEERLKRKHEDIPDGRSSRENKRLKSVVKIASGSCSSSSSTSHVLSSVALAVRDMTSAARASLSPARDGSVSRSSTSSSSSSSKPLSKYNPYWQADTASKPQSHDSFTDSDDDIPLNLTIQRNASAWKGLP